MKKRFKELNKGQFAYRDSNGSLMILTMSDDGVKEAFIDRLMLEYVEEREIEELLERFKQSAQDARKGDTKSVNEINAESK